MTEAQKQLTLYKNLTGNLQKVPCRHTSISAALMGQSRENYEKASMKARDTGDQLSQMKMSNEKASKVCARGPKSKSLTPS